MARKLLRALLGLLPKPLRNRLIREKTYFPTAMFQDIELTIATTAEDYADAFRLVHDAYVDRGWLQSQIDGRWVAWAQALPEATTLILRRGAKTIGTVTIVQDSPVGLPIDLTFSETRALRRESRSFAELSTLALAKGERASGLGMFLMISAWRYAKEKLGVTDLLIAVDAPIAPYYETLFCFGKCTHVRSYCGFPAQERARLEDPVVGLHQDVVALPAWLDQEWASPPKPGFVNPAAVALSPFPNSFESYPSLPASARAAAQMKLPRTVFREFFASKKALEDHDGKVIRYLAQWRSRQTLGDLEEVCA